MPELEMFSFTGRYGPLDRSKVRGPKAGENARRAPSKHDLVVEGELDSLARSRIGVRRFSQLL